MGELSGRSVLITGASGGLGKDVTGAFLAADARVFAVARSWGAASADDRLHYLEADLSEPDAAARVVARVIETTSRIDVLAHLVGGYAGGTPVQEITVDDLDRMLDINLRAAFRMIRAVLPPMIAAQRGRILAIGARAGQDAPANLSAYNISKAALHALIRTVAAEARAHGVTANAVLPGTIDTAANRKAMPKADPSRWVKPADIGALLVWLAGDASSAVNGALIPM